MLRSRLVPLALATLVATAGGSLRAGASDIPVWIVNAPERHPLEAPLRFGLPIPKGTFSAPPTLSLRAPGTPPVPLQTAATERWPDGSIRWLIADAVVAGGRPGARIEARVVRAGAPASSGLRVRAASPIEIRGTRLAAIVDEAGSIRLRVLGSSDPDVLVAPPALTTDSGSQLRTRRVRLGGASGPVRAQIEIEQSIGDAVESRTEVVVWNDSAWVLVRHRVLNVGASPSTTLKTAPVAVRAEGIHRAAVMIDGTGRNVALGRDRTVYSQPHAGAAFRDDTAGGTHLDGAVRLDTQDLAVTVVVPDFWQQCPKSLSISRDGVLVDLFDGTDTPVALGIGAAKSHDVWLRLERRSAATPLPAIWAAVSAPARALAAPAWTRSSGALPGLLDAAEPAARAFLEQLRTDALRYDSRARYERWDDGPPGPCATRTTERPQVGFYGVLHWGDWNFPGYRDNAKQCDAWGNLEYDLPLVFGLAFATTGDPIWATRFERAITHYRDIDIIHAAPAHPEWIGLNHPHKVGHFDWRARGSVDLGHVWLEGLLVHGRLFGDTGSRDAALALARRLAALQRKAGNARQYGWPMIALSAAAAASGDPALRTSALDYARAAIARFPPDPARGDWKIGILASGIAAVHRLTGDTGCRDWLANYGTALLGDPTRHEDPRYVAVAGYLGILTGDRRYDTLATSLASNMPIGTWGKTLAMHGRIGFELLGVRR